MVLTVRSTDQQHGVTGELVRQVFPGPASDSLNQKLQGRDAAIGVSLSLPDDSNAPWSFSTPDLEYASTFQTIS